MNEWQTTTWRFDTMADGRAYPTICRNCSKRVKEPIRNRFVDGGPFEDHDGGTSVVINEVESCPGCGRVLHSENYVEPDPPTEFADEAPR